MSSIDRRTALKTGLGLGLAPLGAALTASGLRNLAAADASAPGSTPTQGGSSTISAERPRHEFELEFIYQRTSQLSAPVIVGPTPEGLRVNLHTRGGTFEGPQMKGKVLPGFGDALIIRKDGVGIIDSRTTMQTDDGAMIFVSYMGVVDLGEGSYERLLAGAPPQVAKLHTGPRFDTAHPKYAWLNRLQGVGIGRYNPLQSVNLWDFYVIR